MKRNKVANILRWTKIILLILILVIIDIDIQSQPGMPPGHGLNGNQGPGGTAPLGEGLLFLLLSSVGYGIARLRKAQKKKKNEIHDEALK